MPLTLLRIEEASQRYRLPRATLQTLIRDGKIRTVRLENEDLVPDEDVAMVAGQTEGTHGNGHWITMEEAVAQYRIDETVLARLVGARIIATKSTADDQLLLDPNDVKEAAGRLDRSRWGALEGRRIPLNRAATDYSLSSASLSRWAKAGHIRVLDRASSLSGCSHRSATASNTGWSAWVRPGMARPRCCSDHIRPAPPTGFSL